MLRQEQEKAVETPAPQRRVTPAELASALARLEAKREGEADGTIGIGEAVSELGLAATPEAVGAEVEVGRAQRAEAEKRQGKYISLLLLLSSVGLGIFIGLRVTRTDSPERQSPPAAAIALPAPQNTPRLISLNPNLLVGDATGKLVMLSEVIDNQPVRCSYGGGSFQPCSADGVPWTLIKHDGNIYVRGKIVAMSVKVMQTDGALVGCDASLPPYAVRVTLPVKRFEVDADAGLNDRFHAVNIRLDKHAYEKWQP